MRKLILLLAMMLLNIVVVISQTTSAERSRFANRLNMAKSNKVGLNPNSSERLQVPFGPYNYKGVDAVSSKFMLDAYPNDNPYLVENLFTTLGLDKVVFDKFILQIFLYCDSEEKLTVNLLNALCGDRDLSKHIFDKFLKENTRIIKQRLTNNPYASDIKERKQQQ